MSLETRAYVELWEKASEEAVQRGDLRSALEAKAKAAAIRATGCPIPSVYPTGQTPLVCLHGHIESLTDGELNELIAHLSVLGKQMPKMGPRFSLLGCLVILGMVTYVPAILCTSWMGLNHFFGPILATAFVLGVIASRFFLVKFLNYVVLLMLGASVYLGVVDALGWNWIFGVLLALPLSVLWISNLKDS